MTCNERLCYLTGNIHHEIDTTLTIVYKNVTLLLYARKRLTYYWLDIDRQSDVLYNVVIITAVIM